MNIVLTLTEFNFLLFQFFLFVLCREGEGKYVERKEHVYLYQGEWRLDLKTGKSTGFESISE